MLSCKPDNLLYIEDEDDDDDEEEDDDAMDEGEDGPVGGCKGDLARAARLLGVPLPILGLPSPSPAAAAAAAATTDSGAGAGAEAGDWGYVGATAVEKVGTAVRAALRDAGYDQVSQYPNNDTHTRTSCAPPDNNEPTMTNQLMTTGTPDT
jgi:hypothetical protein